MPWLDYFWGTLLRAYKEFEARVGTVEQGTGSKSERVRNLPVGFLHQLREEIENG